MVSGRVDVRPDSGEEALRQLALRYAAALAVAGVFLNGGFDVVVEDVIIGHILRDFLSLVPVPEQARAATRRTTADAPTE